jgi:hypothetical protein
MLSIEIDTSKFLSAIDRLPNELTAAIRQGLKDSAVMLIDGARDEFNGHYNTHTGEAARSIQIDDKKTTDTNVTVGLNVTEKMYPVYLHEGTKDHWVGPKDKKALHWVGGKQSFFSRGHMVSGIEKFQFIYIAAEKLKDKIIETVNKHIEDAIKKARLK